MSDLGYVKNRLRQFELAHIGWMEQINRSVIVDKRYNFFHIPNSSITII